MVGTRAGGVGRSASIIAASGSACRNRSGMISVAPAMNAAYGSAPGVGVEHRHDGEHPVGPGEAAASPMQTCIECR